MNYLKSFFIIVIPIFLMGWFISAKAGNIMDSTSTAPLSATPVSSRIIVLGQGYTSMAVTGVFPYGDRAIATTLTACPPNSTPEAHVYLSSPNYVQGDNAIVNYQVALNPNAGNKGIYLVGNVYNIHFQFVWVQHVSDTSNSGSSPGYVGKYTGALVHWLVYCVPN